MKKIDFKNWGLLRIFLAYFKPHRKLFLLDMCCALVVAIVDLVYPLVSRHAMYTMLPEKAFESFFVLMAVVVAAYAVRAVLYYVITRWGHTFGIRVEADIRSDLFCHLQTLGYDYFNTHRTGELMSRLTSDLFEITELAHHGPEDLLISFATIIGALIVMFYVEWRLALVVAIMIPILVIILIARRRHLSACSKNMKAKVAIINTEIESTLSGMKTAKAFANEAREFEKFQGGNEHFKQAKGLFHREMGIYFGLMEFFLAILSVLVISVGGWLIMTEQLNYIDLITFSLYVTSFVTPIRKLINFAEQFAVGYAGLSRFLDIMRTEPALTDPAEPKQLKNVRGEITVDHVDFAYETDLDVLHNVSLTVQPGETIAIVGPSGGGKTTLCQLIPRFYDVQAGSIFIDGVDVRQIRQQELRRQIGIVQQDVFLFADTVYENIRYGKLDATREEIEDAAKKAEIYDDIMSMPNGFDTYVGERGTLLSGGQKQRIAIARIFLKNPPVLILDEATSALDTITEAKIQNAFDHLTKGRTTLIIAHRLSTIRNASRILVISDGIIQEEGTHEALMERNGIYADLYNTQTKLHG